MVWDIPLFTWGQLFQVWSLPAPCVPGTCVLVGWGEKHKRLSLLSCSENIPELSTLLMHSTSPK